MLCNQICNAWMFCLCCGCVTELMVLQRPFNDAHTQQAAGSSGSGGGGGGGSGGSKSVEGGGGPAAAGGGGWGLDACLDADGALMVRAMDISVLEVVARAMGQSVCLHHYSS